MTPTVHRASRSSSSTTSSTLSWIVGGVTAPGTNWHAVLDAPAPLPAASLSALATPAGATRSGGSEDGATAVEEGEAIETVTGSVIWTTGAEGRGAGLVAA